jgi:hypothetical protein
MHRAVTGTSKGKGRRKGKGKGRRKWKGKEDGEREESQDS